MTHRATTIIEHPDRYDAAVSARIKANATTSRRRKWLEADPTREGLIDWLRVTSYDRGGFLMKMMEAYEEWGNLTEGQEAAVRRSQGEAAAKKAQWAAEDAKSTHVGEVGKRQDFVGLTLLSVFEDEGPYGLTFAHKFRDADGNLYHWKTQRQVADKGQTVSLKATVKSHHVSKAGVKSTILTRATVL